MKAKNKKEFEEAWKQEFNIVASLSESLPCESGIALNFLDELKQLRRYIEIASKNVYKGEKNV